MRHSFGGPLVKFPQYGLYTVVHSDMMGGWTAYALSREVIIFRCSFADYSTCLENKLFRAIFGLTFVCGSFCFWWLLPQVDDVLAMRSNFLALALKYIVRLWPWIVVRDWTLCDKQFGFGLDQSCAIGPLVWGKCLASATVSRARLGLGSIVNTAFGVVHSASILLGLDHVQPIVLESMCV